MCVIALKKEFALPSSTVRASYIFSCFSLIHVNIFATTTKIIFVLSKLKSLTVELLLLFLLVNLSIILTTSVITFFKDGV